MPHPLPLPLPAAVPLLLRLTTCGLLLLLVLLPAAVSANPGGLRAVMTNEGLQAGVESVSKLVTEYLHSIEPIVLPPGLEKDGFTIKKLVILNSTHSGVALQLDAGKGLTLTLTGLSAFVEWDVSFVDHILERSAVTHLVDCTLVQPLVISRSPAGALKVDAVDLEFTVGSIDGGGFEEELVKILLNYFLIPAVKSEIEQQISVAVDAHWGTGVYTYPVGTPPRPLTLNYTLTSAPQFSATQFEFEFDGSTHFEDPMLQCATVTALPTVPVAGQEASIYLSNSVVACLLQSVKDNAIFAHYVQSQLKASPFQPDQRLQLGVQLSAPPLLRASGVDSVTADLQLALTIATLKAEAVYTQAVAFALEGSADLKAHLSPTNSSVLLVDVSHAISHLNASHVNTHIVPARYVKQLEDEAEWEALSQMLNHFLATNVTNTPLQVPIPAFVASTYQALFADSELTGSADYFALSGIFASAPTPHTPKHDL